MSEETSTKPRKNLTVPLLVILGVVAAASAALHFYEPPVEIYRVLRGGEVITEPEIEDDSPVPASRTSKPTVVMAILDTVRAQNTSLCGYSRKTTPFLEELVKRGGTHSCRAYSPGDWSVPSHASFFTGKSVLEHGAAYATPAVDEDDAVNLEWGVISSLPSSAVTIAERMKERGYQTALVSANGLLDSGGLGQGFDIKKLRPPDYDPRKSYTAGALRHVLRTKVDPEKPLFLVLNFIEAHDPWAGIPRRQAWADGVQPPMSGEEFYSLFRTVLSGKSTPELFHLVRNQLVDLYDHGVRREDQELKDCIDVLRDSGWLKAGLRMGVTADHGEMLLEHGIWRHRFLYEENLRVPLVLYSEKMGTPAPKLPELVSATVVHDWVLDGDLPEPLPLVHSVVIPNSTIMKNPNNPRHQPAIVVWEGNKKFMWTGRDFNIVDLKQDPFELAFASLPEDHPKRALLLELVGDFEEKFVKRAPLSEEEKRIQKETMEQLKALGYME